MREVPKTKKTEDRTVLLSDRYISKSGVQGGKIMSEYIVLFSFIFGIPFFIMGLILLFVFPLNMAIIIGALLLFVIGLLLIIGGYFIHRSKQT